MVESLVLVIMLATLVTFLTDRVKAIIPIAKVAGVELAPIWAAVIGLAVAFTTKLDLLASLDLPSNPAVGMIITGLVISGGSTAVHELIANLRENRPDIIGMNDITFEDDDE